MRRLMAITAFALSLAVPVWAQHGGHGGGGHAGSFGGGHGSFGGGHGGFSGGHSGFGGGSHFSGGHSGFGGFHSGVPRGFTHTFRSRANRAPFLHDRFRGFHGFRGRRGRDFDFDDFRFRNCWGWGCRGSWWGWGWDPWLWDWWGDNSSYDDDYNRNLEIANRMNEQSLEEQRMRREEEADGDQDIYARSAPPAASTDKPGAPIVPATVLVFRDQHKQEIQNYAIVGQTLWNFSSPRAEKIPLADLDLQATMKVNEDQGVSFRVPVANEAQ